MKNFLKLFLAISFISVVASCTTYSLEEDKAAFVSPQREGAENSSEIQSDENSSEIKDLLITHAPALKIYDAHVYSNKVGTPKAKNDGSVYVDGSEPGFFITQQSFQIEDRTYTNLFYRVHFSEIPFSIFPYHLSWGKNVGLIFVVTLNEQQQPVVFTTAHTCGCYMATMGTSFTPDSFFPDNWGDLEAKQKVYGERLPKRLALNAEKPDICVSIRPHVHRIMDVFACNKSETGFQGASDYPLESLRELESENGPVSFFHEDGIREGLVKGAVKPWESMFLSWASLDLFVGTDKAYLRKEDSDNYFYTSIKPWNHKKSDMADFKNFLDFWGWQL